MSQVPPTPGSNIVIMPESPEPNLVLRVIWFLFLGWWLSFWAILVAALLQLTIIGIPGGIWVINRLPQIMTLKSSRKLQVTEDQGGVTVVSYGDSEQIKWWIRVIYYVLVGWWGDHPLVVLGMGDGRADHNAPNQFLDGGADGEDTDTPPLGNPLPDNHLRYG